MKKALLLILCMAAASIFAETKVLLFAGSTRADSYNKKLIAQAAQILEQKGANVTLLDLNDFPMPFYDADLEKRSGMPENAKRLRSLMIGHDAIVIASPEYNHSIPAVLKNALDWASRGEDGNSSHDAFEGKRVAIMSASPGKKGGAKGLIHLRDIIEDIGGEVISLEVSIPRAHQYFAEKSREENPQLRKALEQLLVQ